MAPVTPVLHIAAVALPQKIIRGVRSSYGREGHDRCTHIKSTLAQA